MPEHVTITDETTVAQVDALLSILAPLRHESAEALERFTAVFEERKATG